MRFQWQLPQDKVLKSHIKNYHRSASSESLERYKFIWREFGPPQEMLFMGGMLAFYALEELRLCYIDGRYIACVLLAQIVAEGTLGNFYIMAGDDVTAQSGFKKLTDAAEKDGYLSPELAQRFHQLRLMRNPYVHPRAGAGEGTLINRFAEKLTEEHTSDVPEAWLKDDAIQAIQIVVDFLRQGTDNFSSEEVNTETF